jgi:hypothetical protein
MGKLRGDMEIVAQDSGLASRYPVEEEKARVKLSMTLELDPFGRTTIESQAEHQEVALGALLRQAVRYYLADRTSGRRGWRYPRFRRNGSYANADTAFDVVVDVDQLTWQGFTREAQAQRVPVERLLEHAALYFVADLSSGLVTARILEAE